MAAPTSPDAAEGAVRTFTQTQLGLLLCLLVLLDCAATVAAIPCGSISMTIRAPRGHLRP